MGLQIRDPGMPAEAYHGARPGHLLTSIPLVVPSFFRMQHRALLLPPLSRWGLTVSGMMAKLMVLLSTEQWGPQPGAPWSQQPSLACTVGLTLLDM